MSYSNFINLWKNLREKEIILLHIILMFIFSVCYFISNSWKVALMFSIVANITLIKILYNRVINENEAIDYLTNLPLRQKLFYDLNRLIRRKEDFFIIALSTNIFKEAKSYDEACKSLKRLSKNINQIDNDIKFYKIDENKFIGVVRGNTLTTL